MSKAFSSSCFWPPRRWQQTFFGVCVLTHLAAPNHWADDTNALSSPSAPVPSPKTVVASSDSPTNSVAQTDGTQKTGGEKAVEIIVDDAQATRVGSWVYGRSGGSYAKGFHFKGMGRGSAYVAFKPNLPVNGDYEVYEWHVAGQNRAPEAPIEIHHRSGKQNLQVQQDVNGSQWNLLGTFPFAVGTNGEVRITDSIPAAGRMIMADAVRFKLVSPAKKAATDLIRE